LKEFQHRYGVAGVCLESVDEKRQAFRLNLCVVIQEKDIRSIPGFSDAPIEGRCGPYVPGDMNPG
jgi:hypothetical protein